LRRRRGAITGEYTAVIAATGKDAGSRPFERLAVLGVQAG